MPGGVSFAVYSPTADLESYVLEQDVIYVGGGNTRSMIALLAGVGLDRILQRAYEERCRAGRYQRRCQWRGSKSAAPTPGPGTLGVLSCWAIIQRVVLSAL